MDELVAVELTLVIVRISSLACVAELSNICVQTSPEPCEADRFPDPIGPLTLKFQAFPTCDAANGE